MKIKCIRIAERAVDAARGALATGVQEKAGFLSYHAFESSGSALGTHIGLDMGKNVTHAVKLKRFQHAARVVGASRKIALLAVRLAPMRNRFLYPEVLPDGTIVAPEAQITHAKATQLLKEVEHVVNVVKSRL
ncbi:MAG TPA: HEPN domain-containing protein [Candidatus Tectomicrobia bacterium]